MPICQKGSRHKNRERERKKYRGREEKRKRGGVRNRDKDRGGERVNGSNYGQGNRQKQSLLLWRERERVKDVKGVELEYEKGVENRGQIR